LKELLENAFDYLLEVFNLRIIDSDSRLFVNQLVSQLIDPKTLQRMARRGTAVGIRIGKLWRFRASQLNEWLQSIGG
jgi:excisionase family DNA binding protein